MDGVTVFKFYQNEHGDEQTKLLGAAGQHCSQKRGSIKLPGCEDSGMRLCSVSYTGASTVLYVLPALLVGLQIDLVS